MIRFVNLLQAPTVSIYQLVKIITFVLYLFDMVEKNKMEMLLRVPRPGKNLYANEITPVIQ